jgi:plastocyanin
MGEGARPSGSASPAASGASTPSSSFSEKSSDTISKAATLPSTSGVFGSVSLSGPIPKLASRPVATDAAICGAADRASPALVLGKSKELANVFVWLEGVPGVAPGTLPKGPFRLDQKGCAFVPYAEVVSAGIPVTILNSDPILHNVHATTTRGDALFNRAIPVQGRTFTRTFTAPGVIRIKCDVHPWMNAWLFVADSPFAAVTGREGRFSFPGVPPGSYRLHAWHELFGEKSQPAIVPSAGVLRADVTLSLLDAD